MSSDHCLLLSWSWSLFVVVVVLLLLLLLVLLVVVVVVCGCGGGGVSGYWEYFGFKQNIFCRCLFLKSSGKKSLV